MVQELFMEDALGGGIILKGFPRSRARGGKRTGANRPRKPNCLLQL